MLVFALPIGIAGFIGFLSHSYYYHCDSHECCQPKWISFYKTGLEADFQRHLFGQHIASNVILKAVNDFVKNDNPQKPLVLSLHGPPGTGKNFVSKMIAKNLYKEGMNSSFVHLFISTHHFQHEREIETYKSQLKQWIEGNVTNCPQSMFIFDEMDKMHPKMIDCIKPYLDYYDKVDGVSYRKAIFIFLSNAGQEKIIQTALDFWEDGRDREEIRLYDVERPLTLSVVNDENSGLWHSSLIDESLVDVFVPFFPLEYRHVVQCVMAEMEAKGLRPNQKTAEEVAKEMSYYPESNELFSVKGCKTIRTKLSFYV